MQDVYGQTAVLLAADGGHQAIVKKLLAAGATIDRFSTNHNTPLHAASFMGHTEVRALGYSSYTAVMGRAVSLYLSAVLSGQEAFLGCLGSTA